MKHRAIVYLFKDSGSAEDLAEIKRVRRMIKSLKLPILEGQYWCMPDKFVYGQEVDPTLAENQFVEVESCLFRHSVKFVCETSSPTKLHSLVELLRAFAEYCGMCSRVDRFGVQE